MAQTVDFINSFFSDRTTLGNSGCGEARTIRVSVADRSVAGRRVSASLITDHTTAWVIPLGDRVEFRTGDGGFTGLMGLVEELLPVSTKFPGCSGAMWGLQFRKRGDGSASVMHLPIWWLDDGNDGTELRESQIFKAFERLRTLSGAPAPVRF